MAAMSMRERQQHEDHVHRQAPAAGANRAPAPARAKVRVIADDSTTVSDETGISTAASSGPTKAGERQRRGRDVVDEREADVAPDDTAQAARAVEHFEAAGARPSRVSTMSAAIDGRSGAAVHRDTDVGERERGGVVHAVAHHHDGARRGRAAATSAADGVAFGFGRDSPPSASSGREAEACAHALHDGRMVARQDAHVDPACDEVRRAWQRASGRSSHRRCRRHPRPRRQRTTKTGLRPSVDHRGCCTRHTSGRSAVTIDMDVCRCPRGRRGSSTRPAIPWPGHSTTTCTTVRTIVRGRVPGTAWNARATRWEDSASSARA
jgi:hypothetical protein